MSIKRDAAIERLRKLLRMTQANGCTEAEAIAAAEKAAAIMVELNLEEGDLEFEAAEVKASAGWASARSPLWLTIATYTNTAVILTSEGYQYVGREPWPEVARYLHHVTDRAINRAVREFQAEKWFKRRSSLRAKRTATHDFTRAMVARLQQKVRELYQGTRMAGSLVEAQAELERRFPSQKVVVATSRRPSGRVYGDAMLKGMDAAGGVQLAHGVAGSEAPLQIGGEE